MLLPLTNHLERVIYLVAPNSLQSWFHFFANKDSKVLFIGEEQKIEIDVFLETLRNHDINKNDQIILYSSHVTLMRDHLIARLLEINGYRVFRQSIECSMLGIDKIEMKKFLNKYKIPTLDWSYQTKFSKGNIRNVGPYVLKERYSTEGKGNTLLNSYPLNLEQNYYIEQYEEGDEYSVIVYNSEVGWVTFPPIWKGKTQLDLTPPFKRLRMCPYMLETFTDHKLQELSIDIARKANCNGFMEVEFIVNDKNEIKVLEINPRISGTMRLSAMATQTDIFSLASDVYGHLKAKNSVIEVPYRGDPLIDMNEQVYSTSRLTVSGDSFDNIMEKINNLKTRGIEIDQHFINQFDCLISP